MRKQREWESIEYALKENLQGICGQLEASDSLKERIDVRIRRTQKEEEHMKRFSIKKIVIVAAIACVAVGTVAVAGKGTGYSVSGMWLTPKYEKFTDLEKVETKAGIQIDAIENFSNGYAFKNMNAEQVLYMNEAGKKEESRNQISMDYYNPSGEQIYFAAQKPSTSELAAQNSVEWRKPDKILKCGDITVEFKSTEYKFVPVDYELTKEDEANLERDDFEISVGSDQVEYNQNYSVSWMKDGISYILGGMDLTLSPDNMLNMAKEIIESSEK